MLAVMIKRIYSMYKNNFVLRKQINCLGDVLKHQCENMTNNVVFEFIDIHNQSTGFLTFNELYDKARSVACLLKNENLNKNDRALLIYPPGLDLIVALFACYMIGVIAIPCYPPANNNLIEKLQLILNDAKPTIILSNQEIINQFHKLQLLKRFMNINIVDYVVSKYFNNYSKMQSLNLETINWIVTDNVAQFNGSIDLPNVRSDDIALIQYTSGSTGHPKGVMISHGNLIENLKLIYDGFGLHDNTIGCFWLPPYHDMGLIGGILTPVCAGVKCILLSPIDFLKHPNEWLNIISNHKVTVSGGPNFAYEYCIKKVTDEQVRCLDLSSWEVAFNGAEPIRKSTLDKFYTKFKSSGFKREALFTCYGLAESTVYVTSSKYNEGFEFINVSKSKLQQHEVELTNDNNDMLELVSTGIQFDHIKIFDPNKKTELSDNQIGEIWVTGESVTSGYWNKPDLTNETFLNNLKNEGNNSRYLRTGDLGFINQNQLYITGRIKELIIINGKNYYPQDIEYTVSNAHHLIRSGQVAAFSITGAQSEELCIVTEIADTNEFKNNLIIAEVTNAIRESVALSFGIYTSQIIFLAPKNIPKTTSGKIRRQYIKKLFLSEQLPSVYIDTYNSPEFIAPRNEIEERLSKIWRSVLKVEQIGVMDNFFYLGGDSMTAAKLMQAIEEEFKIALPLTSIFIDNSIEKQSKLLIDNDTKEQSPISIIQREGSKIPIFAIHPLGGISICYQPISQELGTSQPFYGLDYIDQYFSDPDISVHNLAKLYANEIMKINKDKPFILLGHSSGGLVANQISSLLKHKGVNIALIIMLDSIIQYHMEDNEKEDSEVLYLTRLHNAYIKQANIYDDNAYQTVQLDCQSLKKVPSRERINFIIENAQRLGVTFNEFERFYNQTKVTQTINYLNKCNSFKPEIIDTEILFFKSEHPNYRNPATRDWSPYTTKKVNVIETELSHEAFTRKEHASTIASIIKKYLN